MKTETPTFESTLDAATLDAIEAMLEPRDREVPLTCVHGKLIAHHCHDCSYVYDKFELGL